MNTNKSQLGFSAVEVAIVLVLLAIVGFAGYTVYNRQNDTSDSATTSEESATATDVPSAPDIKTESDLTKAEQTLDQTDPGSSNADAAKLGSEASTF